MAILEKSNVNTGEPIQLDEAKEVLSTGVWGDEAALRLVIQDAERAEAFENAKQWVMQWPTASTLYQSPVVPRYWEGTQAPRASMPFFTLAKAVNDLVPKMLKGLFYDDPPFLVQNRPGTKAMAARAVGALQAFQLEDINFRESLRLGITNAVLFGTAIWKWGWESTQRERKVYVQKGQSLVIDNADGTKTEIPPDEEEIEEEIVQEDVERPFFEHIVNLRHVLVDPSLNVPDIRKAKYVIHRQYMTWTQLEQLRNRPGMNLPTKEQLLALFFEPKEEAIAAPAENVAHDPLWDARAEPRYDRTTFDPLSQPLEVLERVDKDRYIMVLQQKATLVSDENPYGEINFLSVGMWDVPEAFWSIGLGKTIGAEQRLQQGTTCAWLDGMTLKLNGVYTRVRGKSVPTQPIRVSPGKIVDVDAQNDFMPLKQHEPVVEAVQAIAMSQGRVNEMSGGSDVNSNPSTHSNLGRSAAGANLIGASSGTQSEDFVEKLANQVILPFLYHMQEMNASLLPMKNLRYILDKELEHEYIKQREPLVDLLNARVKFSILAAAKMLARRNMAQGLPILFQYLQQPSLIQALAVEGKKIDQHELIRMFFEVSDWKNANDVVVDMTPEDKQRWQSMQAASTAQSKQVGAQKLEQQKAENKANFADEQNVARAGNEVLRQAIEQAATPEEVTGEPGGRGFGTNV